jgi:putative nucleotidyltransferase with HDIG domain
VSNEQTDLIGRYLRYSAWTVMLVAVGACVAVGLIFYNVTLNDFARSIQAGFGTLTSDALREGVRADNAQGIADVKRMASPLIKAKGFLTLTVYDSEGRIVFSTPNATPDPSSLPEKEMLARALAGKAVGRPEFQRGSGVFHVVVPLKGPEGSPPPGALAGTRPLNKFLVGTAQTMAMLMITILLSAGVAVVLLWGFASRARREIERDAAVVSALQSRLGSALQETQLHALGTLQALTAAVDAKDVYTAQHSLNVADYACAIAVELDRSDLADQLERAGLLHDVGKIGIPEVILQKKSQLTAGEWTAVKEHSRLGAEIISTIPSLMEIVPAVTHHHEHWDGSGYPGGLAGDAIPLVARVLATADAFDAMTTSRPYRRAMPVAEAVAELKRCSGSQFDPEMVAALLQALDSGRLRLRGEAAA